MKKRMAKLMSLVLTSAMIVSSPYAGGMEFGAVVYAAEADETDGMILEAGGVKQPPDLLCSLPKDRERMVARMARRR